MHYLRNYLKELDAALAALDLETAKRAREAVAAVRARGSQLFLCGNGGSAATASHMANDLGKGASCAQGAEGRFRVVALTDNVSWITALANDLSYEAIFAEQLRNLGQPGDLLIAISGSGNSRNVLNAVEVAREKSMQVIGLSGFGGGELARRVDWPLVVDSCHMGRVEDVHMVLLHMICYYFMEEERESREIP